MSETGARKMAHSYLWRILLCFYSDIYCFDHNHLQNLPEEHASGTILQILNFCIFFKSKTNCWKLKRAASQPDLWNQISGSQMKTLQHNLVTHLHQHHQYTSTPVHQCTSPPAPEPAPVSPVQQKAAQLFSSQLNFWFVKGITKILSIQEKFRLCILVDHHLAQVEKHRGNVSGGLAWWWPKIFRTKIAHLHILRLSGHILKWDIMDCPDTFWTIRTIIVNSHHHHHYLHHPDHCDHEVK